VYGIPPAIRELRRGAIDAAAQQEFVRRIDDGVNIQCCDIASRDV